MSSPHLNADVNFAFQNSSLTSSNGIYFNVTQAGPAQSQFKLKDANNAMELLMEHVALGALFNSSDRFDPPKCHPETRIALLDSIGRWARGKGDPKPILWLRGAVGAGKSAIAQTISERLEENSLLAASFFFSRTAAQRNEKKYLIPTIAYQLTLSIPGLRPLIERAIIRDSGLFEKSLKAQMTELVIRPLLSIGNLTAETHRIVVIDGLDECCLDLQGQNHEEQQREILDMITFVANNSGIPLRFLIASRPERQIRSSFGHRALSILTWSIILDGTHDPVADIKLFLTSKFEEVRIDHPYIEPSWPSEATISTLLEKSSGHFVYAAVVVRQVQQPRRDPREILRKILDLPSFTEANGVPLSELDALYTYILYTVMPNSLPVAISIFEFLCFGSYDPSSTFTQIFQSITHSSPVFLEKYLFLTEGDTYLHLADLHSLLEIPPHEQSLKAPIRFIHASFSEFLTDSSRAGPLFIDRAQANLRLQFRRLKHCFILSLTRDYYEDSGLPLIPADGDYLYVAAIPRLILACIRKREALPSKEFAIGLAALLGANDEEFWRYIHFLGLSHLRAKFGKRGWEMIGHIYHPVYIPDVHQYLMASGLGKEDFVKYQLCDWAGRI